MLLTKSCHAKIADMGMAKMLHTDNHVSYIGTTGTLAWSVSDDGAITQPCICLVERQHMPDAANALAVGGKGRPDVICKFCSAALGGVGKHCSCISQAPELLLGEQQCTNRVDIYSYGVVMWEVVTGEIPMHGKLRPVKCAPA